MKWHKELKQSSTVAQNCLMFVSELYNFGLLHSVLMYDMLNILSDSFNPDNVSILQV